MVYGLWFMLYGLWPLVYILWSMVWGLEVGEYRLLRQREQRPLDLRELARIAPARLPEHRRRPPRAPRRRAQPGARIPHLPHGYGHELLAEVGLLHLGAQDLDAPGLGFRVSGLWFKV